MRPFSPDVRAPRPTPASPGSAGTPSAVASADWITERVDVGGHKLNFRCKGTGSPALVFENGLGGNLGTWFHSVANAFPSVRTCVYDRVNTGASDRVPARRTGKDSVHDLHTLLDVAAVPPPYLLVGHSFGGLLAAMYAGSYPTEVVGLVLLDPTPPTDAESLNLITERDRAAEPAYIGLLRVRGAQPFSSWVAVVFGVLEDEDRFNDRGGAVSAAVQLGQQFPGLEGGYGSFAEGADLGMLPVD